MKIRNILHKGLRRLFLENNAKGVPADASDKLRKMLTFLQDMGEESELRSIPVWKAHRLAADRKAVWSLHVTRNWRLTFWIDRTEGEVRDLDLEDYH